VDGRSEFLVKWLHYGNNESTWEPFEHVAQQSQTFISEQQSSEMETFHKSAETYISETFDEPKTYHEAISSPEAPYWRRAIANELDSIDKNGTWTFVDRNTIPQGRRPIGSKWIFKRKLKPDGNN